MRIARLSEISQPRVAVLQPGARLHYAVPAVLARSGMLQRFYTDFCFREATAQKIERLLPLGLQTRAVRRMFGRRLPREIPYEAVRQSRQAVVRDRLCGPSSRKTTDALLAAARRDRFGGANTLYTVVVNQDLELCSEAKAAGLRIVHDSMLNPDIGLELNEEYARFPEAGRPPAPIDAIERGRYRDRQKFQLADQILAPSEYVRKSVIALGADPARVSLVPYGIDTHWLRTVPRPVPGRVLFVGSVGLLKGCHYLAEAARRLATRKVPCEVRVVGPALDKVLSNRLFEGPMYVGQVPRSDILAEFLAADVFVLPTLCDGFALAHLEALACGVPVITTPNCGSVVRDGIDGLIVPVRDGVRLAEAIERVVGDRSLREHLSRNARARAENFTWQRYGERLIGALRGATPIELEI